MTDDAKGQVQASLHNRRFTKVDSYGWCDVARAHDLAFGEAMFLRILVELADHRSKKWSGTIVELHEMTRLGRNTVRAYLNRLADVGLITEERKARGARPGLIDVSEPWDELIVPNDSRRRRTVPATEPDRAVIQSDTDRAQPAPAPRHIARQTREDEPLGGSEAIEEARNEGEEFQRERGGIKREWSSDPVELYKEITNTWSHADSHLDRKLELLDLDPGGDWASQAQRGSLTEDVLFAFHTVVGEFEEF